jgi:hypothetical protein
MAPTTKTSNGKNIVSQIKAESQKGNKADKISWKGGYMNEKSFPEGMAPVLFNGSVRPLFWFESFIGQVIYAASETGFNGLIEVVNKQHASKLEKAQASRYHFGGIVNIGEKLWSAQVEKDIEKANKEQLQEPDWDAAFSEMLALNGKVLKAMGKRETPEGLTYQEKQFYLNMLEESAGYCTRELSGFKDLRGVEKMKIYNGVIQFADLENLEKRARNLLSEAIEAIDAYLKDSLGHEQKYDNLQECLYHLAKTGTAIQSYDYYLFLKDLRTFLFDPVNSIKFFGEKGENHSYTEAAQMFGSMMVFFKTLSEEPEHVELERISLDQYGHRYSYKDLVGLASEYQKMAAIAKASRDVRQAS